MYTTFKYRLHASLLLFMLGMCLHLWGCPPTGTQVQSTKLPAGPEEKVYRLSVGPELQVPISENEAMVYRFDTTIDQDGLYAFETKGNVDTLCALVTGEGKEQTFVLVKDLGGTKENCRLLWAFPKGIHRFKVRVDGQGSYSVQIRKMSWGHQTNKALQRDKEQGNILDKIVDRHRYRFSLRASRLVQLHAKGKGLLQCMLRKDNGEWVQSPSFRQPYGSCIIGQRLPAGKYYFELRSSQPQTSYKLLFQEIRMQELPADRVREGYLQNEKTFDIYRVTLEDGKKHILQTYGKQRLRCSLEDKLGHVVIPHRPAPDRRNCLLSGQFKKGTYFLRIKLQRKSSGLYQVSFREQGYTLLKEQTNQTIRPDFQSPFQLYRMRINTPKLYQVEISGRPVYCSIQSKQHANLPVMNLSEPKRCLLFANFLAGDYFLKVIPTTRDETPYRIKVKQYAAPKGSTLLDKQPRLIGPVYPGFSKVFQIESKAPELLTLETRGSLDTNCTLYDGSGLQLARDDDSGKRLNCQLTRYLKPGKYSLKVRVGGRASGLFWVQRRQKTLPWLKPGIKLTRKITKEKRPHTFMLRVNQTALYGFRTESKLDTICSILDQDWKSIAKDDDSGSGKNCFVAKLLTPGIYSFQVKLYRSQKGSFQLFLDRLSIQGLTAGKPTKSTLKAPHWTRFYRVQLTRPGLYTFKTKGKLDTRCVLLNSQSKQIAKNDDAGASNKNCEMVENLQAGVYFFQVWLYKDQRRAGSANREFTALFESKKAPVRTLQLGKATTAQLNPGGIIRYMLTVAKSGYYRFETNGNVDPKCTLFDRSKQQIAVDDDSGRGRNCRIDRRLLQGQYELQVRPATTTRNQGPYTVLVTKRGN